MKVELQCGDSITIPKGCKAIVKDGSVEIEKVQEFKDGDVLVPIVNGQRYYAFIYKSTDKEGFHSYYVGIETCGKLSFCESPSDRWCNDNLSYATEEEKNVLFYSMKENGCQWNAEEKRVEKLRWRAKEGEGYYYVNSNMKASIMRRPRNVDYKCDYEGNSYHSYNYFRTKEHTAEAARRIREALRQYHEEIGE